MNIKVVSSTAWYKRILIDTVNETIDQISVDSNKWNTVDVNNAIKWGLPFECYRPNK